MRKQTANAIHRAPVILVSVAAVFLILNDRVAGQRMVLDFENLGAMTFVSRNPIPADARLSDAFLYMYGVRFSSGSPYVAVVDNGAGHAASGRNGIGGSTPDGVLTYDRRFPVVARFFNPSTPSEPAVTDFVSVRGDLWGSEETITLNAYDINGKLIKTATVPDDGQSTLSIAASGIHAVEFLGTQDDGGVAIDDFTFNPVTPAKR